MSPYYQIGPQCLRIKGTHQCCVEVVYWLSSIDITMFVAGFLVFHSTFMPSRAAALFACMLPITMFVVWLFMTLTHKIEDDQPASLPECPLRNISPFFRRRFDFLLQGYELTGESIYQFKLLKVKSFSLPLQSWLTRLAEHRNRRLRGLRAA